MHLCLRLNMCRERALGPPSNFSRGKISGTVYYHVNAELTCTTEFSCFATAHSMTDYGEPPRHKFVVGVHNPNVPNPCDYALNHDFDFACTFISRPQLQSEIVAFPPSSPQFNQVLFKNALLKPSGKTLVGMLLLIGHRPGVAFAWSGLSMAGDRFK
jgi:hypothetical protein